MIENMQSVGHVRGFHTPVSHFAPRCHWNADRIGSIHNMGALSLNTSSLKSQLKRECSAWKTKYCQNLHRQAKDSLESLTEYMRVSATNRDREIQRRECSRCGNGLCRRFIVFFGRRRSVRDRMLCFSRNRSGCGKVDFYQRLARSGQGSP